MRYLDVNDPCPCGGMFEITHREGGCNCAHTIPPCSWCTNTWLECANCGLTDEMMYDWALAQESRTRIKELEYKIITGISEKEAIARQLAEALAANPKPVAPKDGPRIDGAFRHIRGEQHPLFAARMGWKNTGIT